MTRSELFYFSAGVAVGALGHKALPVLKEMFAPLIAAAFAGASNGASDVYADLAKTFAEKIDNVQEVMTDVNASAAKNGTHEPAASSV